MKCLNCKNLGWGEEYLGKKFFGWCKEVRGVKCKDCARLTRFTNTCLYYSNTPSEQQARECENFFPRAKTELSDYELESGSLHFLASQGGPWCKVLDEAAIAIDSLWSEFKQVERERDAAVRDLKLCAGFGDSLCHFCKTDSEKCSSCIGGTRWQWRGPQEE